LVVDGGADGGYHPGFIKHAGVPNPNGDVDRAAPLGLGILTPAGLKSFMRFMEPRYDIPPRIRVQNISFMREQVPNKSKPRAVSAMRRFARQSKNLNYPIFYSLDPHEKK